MKRIFGIGFYYGEPLKNSVQLLVAHHHYEMRMFGISVGNVFLGVFVRGKAVDKA